MTWGNGYFIAREDKTNTKYPFEKEGRLLVKGTSVKPANDRKRIIVTDKSRSVSLMDKHGNILFSHKNGSLEYVPEIDAYALTIYSDESRDLQIGIVSEKGEMIIPAEYRYYRIIQKRYLKMDLPDSRKSALFDLDKVHH